MIPPDTVMMMIISVASHAQGVRRQPKPAITSGALGSGEAAEHPRLIPARVAAAPSVRSNPADLASSTSSCSAPGASPTHDVWGLVHAFSLTAGSEKSSWWPSGDSLLLSGRPYSVAAAINRAHVCHWKTKRKIDELRREGLIESSVRGHSALIFPVFCRSISIRQMGPTPAGDPTPPAALGMKRDGLKIMANTINQQRYRLAWLENLRIRSDDSWS